VKLENTDHSLVLKDEIVAKDVQHDLDNLGIAKTAREEKLRARDQKQKEDPAYNARMASLYREVVLKEKTPTSEGGFIPLTALKNNGGIAPAPVPAKPEVGELVSGD
jgi:7,8-dihydro-6-hydroxymethylpterin dimethyltransferase